MIGQLFRILKFGAPYHWTIPKYILLVIGAAIFSAINLSTIIPLVQVLFDQVDLAGLTPPEDFYSLRNLKFVFYQKIQFLIAENGRIYALYFVCGAVITAVLLSNTLRYLSQLILAQVRVRIIRNLRFRAYDQLHNLKLQTLENYRRGDLISRITADVQEVEQSAVNSLKVFFKEPFLIVAYLVALVMISPQLTVYSLILVPVAGFAVSLVARRVKKWAKQSQASVGMMGHLVDETLTGIKVIKVFDGVKTVRHQFQKALNLFAKETFQIATKSNLSAPISEVIGTVVLALLLLIGGRLVLDNDPTLSAASFIGFLVIFSQLLNPAKAISVALGQMARGLAAADRVFELIDQSNETISQTQQMLDEDWKAITFQRVGFAYEEDVVLKDIDFTLEKDKQIALVGPSGAGKTTIADLLCQFYQPNLGAILLDGKPIDQIDLKTWRTQISLVTQEPILFNDTVYNNIALGNQNATDEAVMAAANAANAHEFIEALDMGYHTNIGDHGNKLSGGQKQRIAIARAFLKNAPILILDEASAPLDALAADAIQQALKKLMEGRATLIIAHRFSTIQTSDKIIVLDKGRIVQRGTHTDLVTKSGLYQELSLLQAF